MTSANVEAQPQHDTMSVLVVVRRASGGAHVPHSGAGRRLLPLLQECPVFGIHVIVLQGSRCTDAHLKTNPAMITRARLAQIRRT